MSDKDLANLENALFMQAYHKKLLMNAVGVNYCEIYADLKHWTTEVHEAISKLKINAFNAVRRDADIEAKILAETMPETAPRFIGGARAWTQALGVSAIAKTKQDAIEAMSAVCRFALIPGDEVAEYYRYYDSNGLTGSSSKPNVPYVKMYTWIS